MNIPGLSLASWDVFSARVADLNGGSPTVAKFAFRGQADADWTLTPKLARVLRATGISSISAGEQVETRLLSQFDQRAHHHVTWGQQVSLLLQNRMARWAIMQHYGAPTRLLDWTTSAYVAAYFACVSHHGRPGAIFVAAPFQVLEANDISPSNAGNMNDEFIRSLDRSRTKAGFYVSPVLSEREVAQMACFSFALSVIDDHDEGFVKALVPGSPSDGKQSVFSKWTIPSDQKLAFLGHLRAMNIGAHSLFPGLDGLGRSLEEIAYLEAVSLHQ